MISRVSTQRGLGVTRHADHLARILRAQATRSQFVRSPSRDLVVSSLSFRDQTGFGTRGGHRRPPTAWAQSRSSSSCSVVGPQKRPSSQSGRLWCCLEMVNSGPEGPTASQSFACREVTERVFFATHISHFGAKVLIMLRLTRRTLVARRVRQVFRDFVDKVCPRSCLSTERAPPYVSATETGADDDLLGRGRWGPSISVDEPHRVRRAR